MGWEFIEGRGLVDVPDVGGIGSVLGSFATPLSIANLFNNYFGGRADARQEEGARQYEAAMQGLQQAGINPFEIYSPDNVNEMLYTPEGMATLAGLYPGDITAALESGQVNPYDASQKLAYGLIDQFMTNPSAVVNQFAPTDYGRDVVDTVGDIWNDPSRVLGVILGPGGVTGNIEWGGGTMPSTPGSDPAVYTGSPAEGVYTGVSTGDTVIDAVIRKVLGQTVGGETTTSDVIAEQVAILTGYPIDEVIDILGGIFRDTGAAMPTPTTPTGGPPAGPTTSTAGTSTTAPQDQTQSTTISVGDSDTTFQRILDWLNKNKDATDEEIRTAAETAGVTPEDIAGATGTPVEEVQRRWETAGDTPAPVGTLDTPAPVGTLDTTAPVGTLDTTAPVGTVDTPAPVGTLDTPAVVGTLDTPSARPPGQGPDPIFELTPEDIINVAAGPRGDGDDGGGGGGGGGGVSEMRRVDVGQSPLAEIDYLFDIGGESIFAPNIEPESEEDKNLARIKNLRSVGYAQGGQVDVVELALQLLRG